MPFVVFLWLALLHALSPAPSVRPPDDAAAGRRAQVARTVGGEDRAGEGPSTPPREALRAAPIVAEAALARATAPASLRGGTSTPALVAPSWRALASSDARRVLRRHGSTVHALAARGGLLSYFPTAPPRLG